MTGRNWAGASGALLLALGAGVAAAPAAHAQLFGITFNVFADVAPPPLPVYDQPPIPAIGYIWTPGYWAWDPDIYDYYWVPGVWIEPPQPGLLWTPGYWGYTDGRFGFVPGYWGTEIGFYGGVNYGFGYNGVGYEGGYWRGNQFFYNSTVNNIRNVYITNVYVRPVTVVQSSHTSFNGGPGGVVARPTPAQMAFTRQPHVAPTPIQAQHVSMARQQPNLRASINGGRPAIAATSRPGQFRGPGVAAATRAGGPVRPSPAPVRPYAPPSGRPSGPPPGAGAPSPYRPPPQRQDQFRPEGAPEGERASGSATRPPPQHLEQPRPEIRPQAAPPSRPPPKPENTAAPPKPQKPPEKRDDHRPE